MFTVAGPVSMCSKVTPKPWIWLGGYRKRVPGPLLVRRTPGWSRPGWFQMRISLSTPRASRFDPVSVDRNGAEIRNRSVVDGGQLPPNRSRVSTHIGRIDDAERLFVRKCWTWRETGKNENGEESFHRLLREKGGHGDALRTLHKKPEE